MSGTRPNRFHEIDPQSVAAALERLPNPSDPTFELELAAFKERASIFAVHIGLPAVGSRMTNAHGIEWVVDGHTFASSVMTLGITEHTADPRNLYPVSIPSNVSQRLTDMLQELHGCTPKEFVPLDTIPHLRTEQAMPHSHSVDSGSDPNRILLFLDAARIHEAAFAHELGHVWVELVDGIEDYRVLEDLSDEVRYGQVQRIQSFVLDFRVNDLIRSKGFDTSPMDNDRLISLTQLSVAVSKGYTPPSRWESVVMAMLLAEVFVESTSDVTRVDDVFAVLQEKLPEEWSLAGDLAEIIESESRASTESAKRCIDKALTLCFTFAGEHLNLDADLIEKPPAINWRDKWPGWLHGLTPQQKCEVGKAVARSGLGGKAQVRMRETLSGAEAEFSVDGDNWTPPAALSFHLPKPLRPHEQASRIMEINEQNRRRQMERFEAMKIGNQGRRAYSTGEARFITQVRMEQMLAGEHPYAYAFNNPTTYTDPSGESPQKGPRPIGLPGGGFGGCAVYVCYEDTSITSHIPGHESICVTGPHGGCSGGYYPTGNGILSGGQVNPNPYPCKPGWQTFNNGHGGKDKVKCVQVSASCDDASRACSCIKGLDGGEYSAGGNWVIPLTNNCYTWATSVLDCVNMFYPMVYVPPGTRKSG